MKTIYWFYFAAPSGPPTNIVIVDISAFTLIIEWEDVFCKNRGGENQYHYELTSNDNDVIFQEEKSDPIAVVFDLTPCTSYYFKVRAFNRAGYGIFSTPIPINTASISPGKFLILRDVLRPPIKPNLQCNVGNSAIIRIPDL